jgi:DNA (cytosine-5)-methyltransferase 1
VSIKVLDLFSGIGGFSLGLERAGMETVAFCENDKFCQKVLAKHWPDIPTHENIEDLDGQQYRGTVELVCGGFPCQPYSIASRGRLGAGDDRALWPEMLRVIQEVEPVWVICENVPGIINMELDNVLSDLESEGYSCQSFIIPACAVDAPHRRDRVWVVAHSISKGLERLAGNVAEKQKPGRVDKKKNRPASKKAVLAGKPGRWRDESGVCRVCHGVSRRVDRIRSLGNAVVPQVVEVLGRMVIEIEKSNRFET